ncbi:MAG: molecular chaperone DnaJ [Candidatus Eremiobacteraeota bacterium]|nr:molecular chaperone DnaJ [Candidatus Eremiobacteraeota bacterium]
MAQNSDYYAVLGVSPTADAKEIKKQYRRLAKQYHPDANNNDEKAAERFKEISEAYTVIGDAEKRKQYDEMRRLGAFGGFGGGGARAGGTRAGGFGAQGFPGGGSGTQFDFSNVDVGGMGGFSDIFSSIFGATRGGTAGARRGPEPGQTVELTIEVPFRTAALGGKVPVELEVSEECPTCHGSGAAPGATLKQCPECDGRGTISFGQGGFAVNRPCPLCLGRGQIPSEPCPTCRGAGQVRTRRTVNVTVPAGADTGTRVRLKGQGGRGDQGAPPGDLVITFQVLPDRLFRREGLDVIATIPVNVAQATLGSKMQVRTLDGTKVAIRIPAGTSSGRRLRVRGQGIAKGEQRGDMIVELRVTVPKGLTAEQQEKMREFADAAGLKF